VQSSTIMEGHSFDLSSMADTTVDSVGPATARQTAENFSSSPHNMQAKPNSKKVVEVGCGATTSPSRSRLLVESLKTGGTSGAATERARLSLHGELGISNEGCVDPWKPQSDRNATSKFAKGGHLEDAAARLVSVRTPVSSSSSYAGEKENWPPCQQASQTSAPSVLSQGTLRKPCAISPLSVSHLSEGSLVGSLGKPLSQRRSFSVRTRSNTVRTRCNNAQTLLWSAHSHQNLQDHAQKVDLSLSLHELSMQAKELQRARIIKLE